MNRTPLPGSREAIRRDGRRAASVSAVYLAAVLGWNAYDNGGGLTDVAVVAVLGALVGASVGSAVVWTRVIWRAENGRWHVSRTFAALAVGTPAAGLAGALLGGTPLSARGAAVFSVLWVALVLALRILLRIREMRRGVRV